VHPNWERGDAGGTFYILQIVNRNCAITWGHACGIVRYIDRKRKKLETGNLTVHDQLI
jgi:hypothetical protein